MITFYLPLNRFRAFRNNGELNAEETASIAPRCPYCGTTEAEKQHTDKCPVGRVEARSKLLEQARWSVWKDDGKQTHDGSHGWWCGTKDDCIWLQHQSVADNVADAHNKIIDSITAEP